MGKFLIFDWGNTIMVDYKLPGPMFTWMKTDWVEGAEDALENLSAYTCCIASNAGASDAEDMKKGLARVCAEGYFSYFICSKEIGFEKPDPRFFRSVVETIGTDPGNCIMIGDNYEKDIAGAKNAGMMTILFNPSDRTGPFPLADSVIHRMDELPATIEKL